MTDDFKKPTDEWIDEISEVERPAIDFDPSTHKIRHITEKVKVNTPTRYTRLTPFASICPTKQHDYQVIDKHAYIAACSVCPKRRFYRPAFEKVIGGHIFSRDDGSILH